MITFRSNNLSLKYKGLHHPVAKIYDLKNLSLYQRLNSFVCLIKFSVSGMLLKVNNSEAEFKEFELRLKCKPRLKYGWFHLKLYSIFQDLSRRSIKTGF